MQFRTSDIPEGMMIVADRYGRGTPLLIYNIGEVRYALESEAKQALLRSLQRGRPEDVQDVPRRGEEVGDKNRLEEGA